VRKVLFETCSYSSVQERVKCKGENVLDKPRGQDREPRYHHFWLLLNFKYCCESPMIDDVAGSISFAYQLPLSMHCDVQPSAREDLLPTERSARCRVEHDRSISCGDDTVPSGSMNHMSSVSTNEMIAMVRDLQSRMMLCRSEEETSIVVCTHVMQIHCGPSSLARRAYSTSAVAGGPEMLITLQPDPSK
jgi:hypothetical protein